VVANWLTPPPTSSAKAPSAITLSTRKPLSAVSGPTKTFTEKDWPGAITCPRTRSAIRWMFMTRG